MQDPTSPAVFFTSRCWDQNVKGLVSIFLVPTSGLILKGTISDALYVSLLLFDITFHNPDLNHP